MFSIFQLNFINSPLFLHLLIEISTLNIANFTKFTKFALFFQMSSAENSLQQFERIEKEVAAQNATTNPNRQNRDPLGDVSQNSQQPSIQEIDEQDEEAHSLHLPAHEEFAQQGIGGPEGSDLPVELSYQRVLLQNSPSSASTAQATSRPASVEGPTEQAIRQQQSMSRRRSASVGTITSNGQQQQRLASAGTMTSGETEEEERERRKQEMIDRANAMLPRPPTVTSNGPNGEIESDSASTELTTPAHRRFASSPHNDKQWLFSGGSSGTKTPLSLVSPPLFQPFAKTTTTSTLMAPLKVPDFKQVDLQPPPTLEQVKAAAGLTRPMFHSTPHQQQQNPATGKAKKPTTPGGRPISPIAEEREIERLVAEVVEQQQQDMDQRVVKSLVTQLRDLIAQWDWAQARHRHVAQIYFERQHEELNARWEQLNTEMAKFNEQKAEEWAQIAKVRAGLHAERVKQMGKKDADRIRELEQEVTKLKSKEALGSQRASELRTRIRELEGEVRVREQSYTENMLKIKKLERQLVTTEQENSNLRTRNTLLRAEAKKQQGTQPPPTSSASLSNSSQQQQQLPGPRATLFYLNNGGGPRNRAPSSNEQQDQQNGAMRRNNSDSTIAQQQHQQSTNAGRLHRSNSENGGNGTGMPSRQRMVRFADMIMPSSQHGNNNGAPDPNAMALTNDMGSTALNKRLDIPAGMINTMYRITGRGREYTFTGEQQGREGGNQLVVTELLNCRNSSANQISPCLLYEWPTERNFRWLNNIRAQRNRKVQIDYRHADRLYEIAMPRGHLLRFLLDGQMELVWNTKDRTVVMPDGERREIYNPEQPNFRIEIYMPTGVAYRLDAQTQWQREEFVPDTTRMSIRADGAYVVQHLEQLAGTASSSERMPRSSLQINSPDFQLRRFADTRAVKLALDKWAGVQVWLCTDNVLLVKHVEVTRPGDEHNTEQDSYGEKTNTTQATSFSSATTAPMRKRVCYSYGQCRHINTAGT